MKITQNLDALNGKFEIHLRSYIYTHNEKLKYVKTKNFHESVVGFDLIDGYCSNQHIVRLDEIKSKDFISDEERLDYITSMTFYYHEHIAAIRWIYRKMSDKPTLKQLFEFTDIVRFDFLLEKKYDD